MTEKLLLVFTEKINQRPYRFVSLPEVRVKFYKCADAFNFSGKLEADVILIDCGFKARQGLKLLRTLKSLHPQVPVIFLTDISSEDMATAAFRSGAREYLKKPVNLATLQNIIRELLQLTEGTREKRTPVLLGQSNDLVALPELEHADIPEDLVSTLLFINENLPGDISLGTLAKKSRLSKYHFSRYFKKYMKTSPMRYVNSLRIRRARKLLERDGLRFKEIASEVGFKDFNSFTRNFKRYMGLTPRDYKKRFKRAISQGKRAIN